ncbi:hypothetical protein GCM10011507_18480 [Edaphobacter acidisoli]|uniref:TonB-dependent transporter Oar-like beta-barrel domain-containing protein n=1 Tax=Edaphobacter acidisoli TaxID=2040573 RepID=A0A916RSS2_9BACT|nr:hypothetical protein GCM10011507_18480 [Edaphobacter acidisoli]
MIPDAEVILTETATHIASATKSNREGLYTFPSVKPGQYDLSVKKAGFGDANINGLTLTVQANVLHDVSLSVGATAETITVNSETGELMQKTSSELGTVIDQKAIHELPLNGRNFTQLLTLTPGATPISTSQSAGVGVNDLAVLSVPTASVAQPSIQGQTNRSNLYLLDGVVNTEMTGSVYVIPPIVDAMQEFKVQSHDDKAEYGSVLGGVINVVTKSGTNSLHGAAWEFVRNNIFDARDSFADEYSAGPSPFRQNQFGVTVGGPVFLPKIYDGHNRTFFFFGYEGWRYVQAAESKYIVPTDAELSGDFSHSTLAQNIYDPATTSGSSSTGYARSQFPGNIIPSSRLNSVSAGFLKAYYARPNLTGDPVYNAIVTRSSSNFSNHYMARADEQLGSRNSIFFRYDRLNVTSLSPTSISQSSGASVPALNIGVGWTGVLTPKLLADVRYGLTRRPFARYVQDSAGIGPMQGLGFNSVGGTEFSLGSPYGSGGLQAANTINSPVQNWSPSLTWVVGNHTMKYGMQYVKQGNDSNSPAYGGYTFANDQTGDPNQVGTTGNSLASALLGLPSQINNTTTVSNSNRVSTYSFYFQDVWAITKRLTMTYGLRFDHRREFSPSSSTVVSGLTTDGLWWIGLDALPPACSQTNAAPCIPGNGSLSSIANGNKIMLSPYGRAWGPAPRWQDWGPRIGLAYQVNDKMVLRGGYGIVYDPLMGFEQDWKGFAGSWPATGSVTASVAINQLGSSPTPVQNTFSTVGIALPGSDPWSTVTWFMDPKIRDPRSQQYNLAFEYEVASNLSLSVGYVGSHSDRLSVTGIFNTAQTAGPGTPDQVNARKPFPWVTATPFMSTDRGSADYNGLQVKLDKRYSNGLEYLVSYTFSKSIDEGGSGLFDVENGPGGSSALQNYYDVRESRSVSSYDVPQFLSIAGQYELPFGRGKKMLTHGPASYILGNWQLNTVAQIRSGQPYNLSVVGDVANIGTSFSWWNYARPNEIASPKPAHQTALEWYNPASFAVPVNSYGNFPRNSLRTSHVATADASLFKNFPFKDEFALNFRAEAFNVFNIQNYGAPDTTITDPGAGRITSNVLPPRQIQLGLHLSF